MKIRQIDSVTSYVIKKYAFSLLSNKYIVLK